MASKLSQRQYYFAFGSNMSLTQMAERCPGSTFIGRATLSGYRWQINQRHVANIVSVTEEMATTPADQADVVEGLVFSITDKDRRVLDRKEGIKIGIYERIVLPVLLQRHSQFADNKTAFVRDRLQDEAEAASETANSAAPLAARPQKDQVNSDARAITKSATNVRAVPSTTPANPPPPPATDTEEAEAITYLSTKYSANGLIRREYVHRMENAISDAVKLGVSQDFVRRSLEPYVHGEVYQQPEKDVPGRPQASKSPPVAQKEPAASQPTTTTHKEDSTTHRPKPSRQGDRNHGTLKKSHDQSSKKQSVRRKAEGGEDEGKSRRIRPEPGREADNRAREHQAAAPGIWSSISSTILGSNESQGRVKGSSDSSKQAL